MNDIDLENFRQQLLQIRAELEQIEQESKDGGDTVELDQTKVGRLSRMDAMQQQQMALESERRRKLQLQKIEASLKRIQNDDYGYCFVCGEDIAIKRLQADPTHTKCINCAE